MKLTFVDALNFLKNPSNISLRAHVEAVMLYYDMNYNKLIPVCP